MITEPRRFSGLSEDRTYHYAISTGGKSNRANFKDAHVQAWLDLFPPELMHDVFKPEADGTFPPVCLYGEGYGAGINKGSLCPQ